MKFRKIKKNKLMIPDNDLNGISDSVFVESDHKVQNLILMVELIHTHPGDLSIELIAPSGSKEVFLSPGNNQEKTECFCLPSKRVEDLCGNGTKGEWTINLIDTGMKDQGYLISWELDFDVDTISNDIIIEDQSALELTYNCEQEGTVVSLDVDLDIEHEHIGDLEISLMSPDGYEEKLYKREGKDQKSLSLDLNTYELHGFRSRTAKGIWRMIIEDKLKGDTGIVSSWSIKIGSDE